MWLLWTCPVRHSEHKYCLGLGKVSRSNHKIKIQSIPIVLKPGSLDSSDDVEYYGFYIFALPFLVFEIFNF